MSKKTRHTSKLPEKIASEGKQSKPAPDVKNARVHFVALFGILMLGYLLTFSGAHYGRVSDGKDMLETALSICEFRELSIFDRGFGPGGKTQPETYSKYGLGFPLVLQLPLFLADHLEFWLGWKKADYLFAATNLLLNLLTSLILAAVALRITSSLWAAYGASLAFAFGSFAWPYISFDFSEPLQAFCLVLAFWALLRATAKTKKAWAWLILSGVSLGMGILAKSLLVTAMPAFAAYLWFKSDGTVWQRLKWQVINWIPVAACGILIAVLNMVRFHSVFEFGYKEEASRFTASLWTGLFGLLLSPSKGLVFFAPVTILLPLAAVFLFKRHRPEFIFLCLLSVFLILPVSLWWSWEGGASWGPRLLYPLLPFLILFSVFSLISWKFARYGFVLLLCIGMMINLLGVLFYFSTWGSICGSNGDMIPLNVEGRPESEYQLRGGEKYFQPYVAINYIPSLSPILGHAWVLRWRYFAVPFPLKELLRQPPVRTIPFGPLFLNFDQLKEMCASSPALARDLETAQLAIPDALAGRSDSRNLLPVRGRGFLDHGDRFSGLKEYARAYSAYRRAYELRCDTPTLLPKLGITCFRLEKISEGCGYFDQFLAQFPTEHRIRLIYAQALETNRQFGKALEQFRRLKELQPNHPQMQGIEQRIGALSEMAKTNTGDAR